MTLIQKLLAGSAAVLAGFYLFKPKAPVNPYAAPNLPPPLTVHTPGRSTSNGTEYPLTHLPQAWTSAQVCAFVTYMRGLLVTVGITGRAAQLFIAHISRETGFGRNVYGNSFGNVKAHGSDPWMRLHDGLAYKVYASPFDGILGQVAFMRDSQRYGRAWQQLIAGQTNWYSTLGIAGYYQFRMPDGSIVDTTAENVGASQADYERTLASVVRCWT